MSDETSTLSTYAPGREQQVYVQGWLDGFDHARRLHRSRGQRAARRLADGLTLAGSAVRRLR